MENYYFSSIGESEEIECGSTRHKEQQHVCEICCPSSREFYLISEAFQQIEEVDHMEIRSYIESFAC